MPSNPNTNTDTLVKQTAKTDNVNYKLLGTASASPISGNAAEAIYDANITINPSTHTITATNFAGNASTATKLATARTIQTNLASTSSASFNGSANITPGVTGTLGVGNGGTGATTAAGARANLGTWALISDSYPTLMPADGTTNNWIKIGKSNTSYGLLPSTSGGAGSGHNYIGTSSWYWKYAYIDQIYGYLNGNISGNAATATKATQDSSGNVITSTYVKKSGDTMTGTLYITSPSSESTVKVSNTGGNLALFSHKSDDYCGLWLDPKGTDTTGRCIISVGPNNNINLYASRLNFFKESDGTFAGSLAHDGTYLQSGSSIHSSYEIVADTGFYTGSSNVISGLYNSHWYALVRNHINGNVSYDGCGGGTYLGWYNNWGVYLGPEANGWKLMTDNTETRVCARGAGHNGYSGGSSLVVRECQECKTNQSHLDYAPKITWYWGNRIEMAALLESDGVLRFRYYDTTLGTIQAGAVHGAVWNDYAEMRNVPIAQQEKEEPRLAENNKIPEKKYPYAGRCVREVGDDTMVLTTERLQRGCKIISDTFGFNIGETEDCKTPIAVSGRALVYLYEDRELARQYIGWPVCSGPDGTVSIMTEEEEEKYPSRIVGTISAVPDYEEWGSGKVKVNGRIWIYVR